MSDELKPGEVHPMAAQAMDFIKLHMNSPFWGHCMHAIEESSADYRSCEIAKGTFARIERGEAVGDRYVLGAAWFLIEVLSAIKERDLGEVDYESL